MNFFGTDGIRTRVGNSPLTLEHAARLGYVIGYWITAQKKCSTIYIAQDTRISGPYIQSALQSGLLLNELKVIDAGIVPTPALSYFLQKKTDCAGIMITASHNKYQDNGIKIFYAGKKLNDLQEQEIEHLFDTYPDPAYKNFGTINSQRSILKWYTSNILSLFSSPFLSGKKIVLDCANGAWSKSAPLIYRTLGAELICIAHKPDGKNINDQCGATDQTILQETVLKHQADLGIAFDGDGDRVGIVTRDGKQLDGDDILYLLSTHPQYRSEQTLVGTIMTNEGLAFQLKKEQKQLIRTPVGDKHVMAKLIERHLPLGSESSGHVIIRHISEIADGLLASLKTMEALSLTNNWDCISFKKYPNVLINLPVLAKKDLTEQSCSLLISSAENMLQGGRIVVRYSGTEPVLRIMVEAPYKELAEQTGMHLSKQLEYLLS